MTGPAGSDDSPGREMAIRGPDGKLSDAELWDEILGDDTEGTWQVTDGPPADAEPR